jgi:uncharacterized membrane protein YfcA
MLWSGLTLYGVSFFLYAVNEAYPAAPQRGWMCAVEAFAVPLLVPFFGSDATRNVYHGQPLIWLAAVVTGWINPVFITSVAYLFRDRHQTVRILRIVLFGMMLCCGIVFYSFKQLPREGFVLWVIGMLLVVWSPELSTSSSPRARSSRQSPSAEVD